MNDVIIETKNLDHSFRNGRLVTPVLFDINLRVRRAEFVAVMGPSGCGKSTLMHILGLMLRPTRGTVLLDGHDTSTLSDNHRARLRREKIGFVFQRFNLLPTVSAYQNLLIAQRIRGRSLDGQVTRALEAVDMADKARHKPGQLSIGQQQRVALARAVCHEPDIIMADEPTGNLDSDQTRRVLSLLQDLHRRLHVTVLMITHSAQAAAYAQRIVTMNDGRLVSTPSADLESPQALP